MRKQEIYNQILNGYLELNEAIELLQEQFNFVKKEGNGLGIYCFDEFDKNITFICIDEELKGVYRMELEKKFNIPYDVAPDTIDYSVCIYESVGSNQKIYSNVNWNESNIYLDFCYPDFIVDEWEHKAI